MSLQRLAPSCPFHPLCHRPSRHCVHSGHHTGQSEGRVGAQTALRGSGSNCWCADEGSPEVTAQSQRGKRACHPELRRGQILPSHVHTTRGNRMLPVSRRLVRPSSKRCKGPGGVEPRALVHEQCSSVCAGLPLPSRLPGPQGLMLGQACISNDLQDPHSTASHSVGFPARWCSWGSGQ